MYYALIGVVTVFVVSLPVSYLTGGTSDVDEILLTPWVRSKDYKQKQREALKNVAYSPVLDTELKVVNQAQN